MIREALSIENVLVKKPSYIKDILFFSKDYSTFVNQDGREFFLLYSDSYVVPFVLSKKLFFKYGTFIYQPIPLTDYKNDESVFLDECLSYLKSRGVHFITSVPAYTLFQKYPSNSKRIPFGNYVCDLSKSEDELLSLMHPKHRNSIKKADKEGVIIKKGKEELLDDYIILDKITWNKSNTKSHVDYANIIKSLPNNCLIFIAYKDSLPQSGAIVYYDSFCGYYMYGANLEKPFSGSGNLLQWEVIKFLKEIGTKQYSFVGCRINEDENSKYHNIQRFKSRFGGELKECFLFKSVLNKYVYWVFRILLKIKRIKIIDAIDEEIYKWPNLNRRKK